MTILTAELDHSSLGTLMADLKRNLREVFS